MNYKIYRLSEIDDALFRKWYREADEDRRSRVLKMKSIQAQKQSLCADGLARKMLANGIPAADIRFRRRPGGKPEAVGSPLHFNLSHSGDFVLCAVSDEEIGADIEVLRPVPPNLIRRVCTEKEQLFVRQSSSRFLQVWTAKEALSKFCGEGLRRDLKELEVVQEGRLQIPGLAICTELTEEYAMAVIYKT